LINQYLIILFIILSVGCNKTSTSVKAPPYDIYLPKDYQENDSKPRPLLVFLHGYGQRGSGSEWLPLVRVHGPLSYIDQGNDLPFIIAAPQLSRDKEYWTGYIVDALIKDVEEKYSVYKSRISLTGLSMGGYATWIVGMFYPDRFAALAPVAGGDIFQFDIPGIGNEKQEICRLKEIPIWAFHGEQDTIVPVEGEQEMIRELNKCDAKVKFTLYKDKGHDSWTETYNNPEFYQWLAEQKRTD
jgi:predicted peptidase